MDLHFPVDLGPLYTIFLLYMDPTIFFTVYGPYTSLWTYTDHIHSTLSFLQ